MKKNGRQQKERRNAKKERRKIRKNQKRKTRNQVIYIFIALICCVCMLCVLFSVVVGLVNMDDLAMSFEEDELPQNQEDDEKQSMFEPANEVKNYFGDDIVNENNLDDVNENNLAAEVMAGDEEDDRGDDENDADDDDEHENGIESILKRMGVEEKYIDLILYEEFVDIEDVLELGETDLIKIGVDKMGKRKNLLKLFKRESDKMAGRKKSNVQQANDEPLQSGAQLNEAKANEEMTWHQGQGLDTKKGQLQKWVGKLYPPLVQRYYGLHFGVLFGFWFLKETSELRIKCQNATKNTDMNPIRTHWDPVKKIHDKGNNVVLKFCFKEAAQRHFFVLHKEWNDMRCGQPIIGTWSASFSRLKVSQAFGLCADENERIKVWKWMKNLRDYVDWSKLVGDEAMKDDVAVRFKLVDFEREPDWDGFNDWLAVHDVRPASDPLEGAGEENSDETE